MGITFGAKTAKISLADAVSAALTEYFNNLRGTKPIDLYQIVLEEIEAPLLQVVMEKARYNQSRAAKMLGISRATLRGKLRKYFDDKYVSLARELDDC